jgi:hypothetical protein
MELSKVKYGVAAIILVTGCVGSIIAQDGVAMLKIDHGARSSGMGSTSFSQDKDPNLAVYNPALGLGFESFTASFGHTEFWENIRLESGFFAGNLTKRVALHGGIRYAAIKELEGRTLPTSSPETIFDAQDIAIKGGLAYKVTPKLDLGIAAGWIMEKIGGYRGSAFNIDFGAVYQADTNITLAASATNVGSSFQLEQSGLAGSDDVTLPTIYRIGGSYRYTRYLGAVELVYLDDKAHAHIGAEAKINEMFSVRSGYIINYDTKNFTAGTSFSHRNITVDYAFIPFSQSLGTSHLFNLTFSL